MMKHLLLLGADLAACPVCFGKSLDNAGVAKALTFGIAALLFFTFAILGSLVAAVIRIERAKAAAEAKT